MRETLVIIPAYNEEKNLPAVLQGINAAYPDLDVLVVDDGSYDRTRELAKANGGRVVSLPFNLGYGAAVQTGYKYAMDHGYQYVIQLDADGQHEIDDMARLLEPIKAGSCDLALGSRFLGRKDYQASLARSLGSWFFGVVASKLLGQRITDPTSGFQAMNARVLRIYMKKHFPEDYPDADILGMLHYYGIRILEIPVRMYPKQGASMHSGFWRPLYYIAKMCLSLLVIYSLRNHFHRGRPAEPSIQAKDYEDL